MLLGNRLSHQLIHCSVAVQDSHHLYLSFLPLWQKARLHPGFSPVHPPKTLGILEDVNWFTYECLRMHI